MMTIKNLLTGADKAIEEDKALEKSMAISFEGDEIEIEAIHSGDSPLPIDNSEEKVFGAMYDRDNPPHWAEGKAANPEKFPSHRPGTPSPKSPEDMEKEYISEAEKTIEECNDGRKECLAKIHKHEEEVSKLRDNIATLDRLQARAKTSLEDIAMPDEPKTPKETKAKT